MRMEVRDLRTDDWPEVARIYGEGIQTGDATFETEVPPWATWDAAHLERHRIVAERWGSVLGWVALSPVSDRCCYAGVADVSVYVAAKVRGGASGARCSTAWPTTPRRPGSGRCRPGSSPR